MTEEVPQWSDEAVASAFRTEIHNRFWLHNAAFRTREEIELQEVLRAHPEKRGQPGYEVHDSTAWMTYRGSDIRIDRNVVTIVLPPGAPVGIDLLYMFDNTTVAWSRPLIGTLIVNDQAHVTIEILLVATWNDSLDTAWRKDGNDRRQILVELFDTEIHTLLDLVDKAALPTIRDRLSLALEVV